MQKPQVVVSKCLGFARCRYDGQIKRCKVVEKLRGRVDFLPVCPEVEIGLGVTREPICIVRRGSERRLVRPTTGEDFTCRMRNFSRAFLSGLREREISGFILKSRSPSCGLGDVKILGSTAPEAEEVQGYGSGFFAAEVVRRFPDRPVESDASLEREEVRRQFVGTLLGEHRTGPDK